MRFLIPLLCAVSLSAADVSRLRELERTNRIFELRRALQQPGWSQADTLFYRAVVSARLGDEKAGIEDLRRFLAASPESALAREAWEELASAYARIGHYREAADAWTQALSLTSRNEPERAENENTQALYAALADVAPQTVEFAGDPTVLAFSNHLGSWNVPVEINGHRADWIFDTGANLSTVSESGAREMGLTVTETKAYVRGSTGVKNGLHIAVANGLRLGPTRLNNVVLLVVSDQSLYISPFHYRIQGILGLPVIRALGVSQMSAKGLLLIGAGKAAAQQEPDLFFDELRSIVEIRHGGQPLQLYLDTGATRTDSYPSIRSALSGDEQVHLRKKREKAAGAGGMVRRAVVKIPQLRFELAGRNIDLKNVDLFYKQPSGGLQYYDGVLGMDALASGFTLDYRTMRLLVN
ncbi:MAG TPA: aspartyl protease family protein [Bryobacteraceae bacterium]|nr:aspartyl protease family protein [Bryobacteraceae bacterium]